MYIGVKVLVTYDVAYTFESKESEDIFLLCSDKKSFQTYGTNNSCRMVYFCDNF